MEDPSGDWEIVNYPSSEDVEIAEKNGSSSSKLEWVVNTGLSLGKKAVIAGFVMTSVPVMLPPLAVVSALGIASSLPFGLMFASYACTERLMSKLLPHSPSQEVYNDYVRLGEDEKNGGAYEVPVEGGELTEKPRCSADEIPRREEGEFVDDGKNGGAAAGNGIDDVKDGNETKEGSVGNGEEHIEKSIAAEEQQPPQQQNASKGKSNSSSKKKKKTTKKSGLSEKEATVKNKDADSSQEAKKTVVEKENQRKEVVELPEKNATAAADENRAVSEDRVG